MFCTFWLRHAFAPQRRALFRHRNFQKWSEAGVLYTFWLGNVLRATTACNCSSLIWPAGSAPVALASLLFDPPEPQIIGKNTVFRDFPTFSRTWIFFLRRLSLSWSSFLFSSLLWLFPSLLFTCPYCRKFGFKLPSVIYMFCLMWLWYIRGYTFRLIWHVQKAPESNTVFFIK